MAEIKTWLRCRSCRRCCVTYTVYNPWLVILLLLSRMAHLAPRTFSVVIITLLFLKVRHIILKLPSKHHNHALILVFYYFCPRAGRIYFSSSIIFLRTASHEFVTEITRSLCDVMSIKIIPVTNMCIVTCVWQSPLAYDSAHCPRKCMFDHLYQLILLYNTSMCVYHIYCQTQLLYLWQCISSCKL